MEGKSVNRIRRNEVSEIEWNNYLIAENKAHNALVQAGFTPQGINKDFTKVVVAKEYGIGKHADFYYFDTWQDAQAELCN